MAAIEAAPTMAGLDSLLCQSSLLSSTPTDASSSNSASLSSTPPTTISPDSMSLASEPDAPKPESVAASSIEAAIQLPEKEQPQSRQQTPVGHDAIVVAEQPLPAEPPSTGRPRRVRQSLPVYNIAKLIGTDVHGRRRSKGDTLQEERRRTTSGDAPVDHSGMTANESVGTRSKASPAARGGVDPSDLTRSNTNLSTPKSARISKKSASAPTSATTTRRATRSSGAPVENIANKLSTLSKRGKKSAEKLSRELKRLQDTNEFAHIDTRPVRYTIWSNGKYVDPDAQQERPPEPPRKKVKVDDGNAGEKGVDTVVSTEKQGSEAPVVKKPRVKKWLEKGLYAGQEAPMDIFKGLTSQEKKKLASLPELMPSGKPNRTLPQPMYNGLRILIHGRDFKLPFDVCHPLPPGQPKPAAYRTMTKNRFVGDAAAYWKKTPHFGDFASKCVCKPEDGCGEDCQNRIMLYECDETNCNIGKAYCTNRAFQDLQERTKKGGRYRVGVEVFKTVDRGYGVRSNRCFEPNQIIMEYTGEIITEEECERRMNEEYKNNECYYLMSFDQNMIIDATTGSIARFVNHSCSPNCRMIKWIVSGQPRMALFAGDRPIMTGEELTYDYNFDPFSAKNVQKCLCGSANCRGVLGPKPKEVKPPRPPKEEKKVAKKSDKSAGKAGNASKRKLKDLLSGDKDEQEGAKAVKKRKIKIATGVKKKPLSSANLNVAKKAVKKTSKVAAKVVAKGAAKIAAAKGPAKIAAAKGVTKSAAKGAVVSKKHSVSSTSVGAKTKTKTGLTSPKGSTTKTTTSTTTILRATSAGVIKTYGKKATQQKKKKSATILSRSPSLTIVAAGVSGVSTTEISVPAKQQQQSTTIPAAQGTVPVPVPVPAKKTTTTMTTTTSSRKVTPSRKALEAAEAAAVEKSLALLSSSSPKSKSSGKARKGGSGVIEPARTPKIRLVTAAAK
ncbi:hypothetical protein VTK56DRAFT_1936 [Thermocarpiscus australiensis]